MGGDHADRQHGDAAEYRARRGLQDKIVGGLYIVEATVAGHDRDRVSLKKISSQGAGDQADDGVAPESEGMVADNRGSDVGTDESGDNLDVKAGGRPKHWSTPPFA